LDQTCDKEMHFHNGPRSSVATVEHPRGPKWGKIAGKTNAIFLFSHIKIKIVVFFKVERKAVACKNWIKYL
jgi:hypothetical protein